MLGLNKHHESTVLRSLFELPSTRFVFVMVIILLGLMNAYMVVTEPSNAFNLSNCAP